MYDTKDNRDGDRWFEKELKTFLENLQREIGTFKLPPMGPAGYEAFHQQVLKLPIIQPDAKQKDGKLPVSRRLVNTYIVVLKCDHSMMEDETVKLHELENGEWYKEDYYGRLYLFKADVALKLVNGG